MIIRPLLIVAALLLVAACGQPGGTVYRTPLAEARQTLMATELPPMVFGSQPPDLEVLAEGQSGIVWVARRNGDELFRYVANLSADGADATRVTLELKGANDDITRRLSEHPRIRDLYLVAMKERIASALERRPFEMSRIYPALTAATAANIGTLAASADEAAAASNRMARENIEKAYRDEAAGR